MQEYPFPLELAAMRMYGRARDIAGRAPMVDEIMCTPPNTAESNIDRSIGQHRHLAIRSQRPLRRPAGSRRG